MALNTFIAFWSISILFVITPGADWAYAISAGIKGRILPAISGLLLGHLMATIIVAAGVGTIVASKPIMLMVLTVIGSIYLLWTGGILFFYPPHISSENSSNIDIDRPWWSSTIQGFGISGLNPKVFLLFLALLPQFINPSISWSIPLQIISLGFIHILNCAVIYVLVGFSAQIVLKTRPRAAQIVSRISGSIMILIAIILIINQAKNYFN
ncbi:LysE family translocator [Acinetobacter sp. B5B]|uniref:LysE family translocator n=1 Tax=Acinetobacter baretiae TaxID=2605383 RepID=UPI0018C27080|nr:LysE family translocator [Acinetobacter baretiae]MBF7684138.1 LysE family translocator [Acinetobacter baretiae]